MCVREVVKLRFVGVCRVYFVFCDVLMFVCAGVSCAGVYRYMCIGSARVENRMCFVVRDVDTDIGIWVSGSGRAGKID